MNASNSSSSSPAVAFESFDDSRERNDNPLENLSSELSVRDTRREHLGDVRQIIIHVSWGRYYEYKHQFEDRLKF